MLARTACALASRALLLYARTGLVRPCLRVARASRTPCAWHHARCHGTVVRPRVRPAREPGGRLLVGLGLTMVVGGCSQAECGWFSRPAAPERHESALRDKYEVDENVLGYGCFGEVRAARRRKGGEGGEGGEDRSTEKGGSNLAVKTIDVGRAGRVEVAREVAVMRQIAELGGCPHIVALVDVVHDARAEQVHIVMERAEGGDLFDAVQAQGAFTERHAARLARELALALRFLHEHGFVHQDIKPENVMFGARGAAQLVDFGCCVRAPGVPRSACGSDLDAEAESGSEATQQLFVQGTTGYMPPEWQRAAAQRCMHASNTATDMWGLGCVLFIVLAGFHPFDPSGDASVGTVEARVLSLGAPDGGEAWHVDFEHSNWAGVSESAKDLVRALLSTEPERRPLAQDVLEHPWVVAAQGQKARRPKRPRSA